MFVSKGVCCGGLSHGEGGREGQDSEPSVPLQVPGVAGSPDTLREVVGGFGVGS